MGNVGAAGGFLLGPLLVTVPAKVPSLMYVHAALGLLNLVCVMAYFPNEAVGQTPATRSASKSTGAMGGIKHVITNGEFMKVSVAGGAINGIFNVWSGSFDQILPPLGKDYSQSACGWIGFIATMAMILGACLSSPIADTKTWSQRMKVGGHKVNRLLISADTSHYHFWSGHSLYVLCVSGHAIGDLGIAVAAT